MNHKIFQDSGLADYHAELMKQMSYATTGAIPVTDRKTKQRLILWITYSPTLQTCVLIHAEENKDDSKCDRSAQSKQH